MNDILTSAFIIYILCTLFLYARNYQMTYFMTCCGLQQSMLHRILLFLVTKMLCIQPRLNYYTVYNYLIHTSNVFLCSVPRTSMWKTLRLQSEKFRRLSGQHQTRVWNQFDEDVVRISSSIGLKGDHNCMYHLSQPLFLGHCYEYE